MIEVVIYGKIIIDDLRRLDGTVAGGLLGGGGPQAGFGARLWSDSVGLVTRVGPDLAERHRRDLEKLQVDLSGVTVVPHVRTLRAPDGDQPATGTDNWQRMLAVPVGIPAGYRRPRVVHLITEYADEPMVEAALAMRRAGALLSLEPLIDHDRWTNAEQMMGLLRRVDVVTPDWPSASGLAASTDPALVLRYWARTGPALVAVRHCEHGSYLWSAAGGRSWHIPAVPVRVADPTGAGNSYGGGLCAAWFGTRDPVLAGVHAAVSASFMLELVGMPTDPISAAPVAQARLRATVGHVSLL